MHMMIIADDLTGALDAGVCMLPSQVVVAASAGAAAEATGTCDVLSVNAGTRHMDAEAAYCQVASLVRKAKEQGVHVLFKKTDSALRGNIGAELAAAYDAAGAPRLHFIPAFPAMGRTTSGGRQYVNGMPVDESSFGRDPFEPVISSDIAEIISAESRVPVRVVGEGDPVPQDFCGIVVYDAASDASLDARVHELQEKGELKAVAGCAGLSSALHRAFAGAAPVPAPAYEGNLLAVCGSVNPASRAQCRYAEKLGYPVFHIGAEQKCRSSWPSGPEGRTFVRDVSRSWKSHELTVIDGSGLEDLTSLVPAGSDIRQLVADNIAGILLSICESGIVGRALVMGGDILSSFLVQAQVGLIYPLGSVEEGIVCIRIDIDGKPFVLAAKSGGFGNEKLFASLAESPRNTEGAA